MLPKYKIFSVRLMVLTFNIAIMKRLLFFSTLFVLSLTGIAQNWLAPKVTLDAKDFEKMKKETLYILNGYDKEFDEAVKYAVDKYWTLTPVKYINVNDLEPLKKDKTCKMYLGISGYAVMNYGRKFTHNELNLSFNHGFWSTYYTMQFDNLTKPSGEILGADKDFHQISNKIVLNIMMMCVEMKKSQEMGDKAYREYSAKSKLSSYTVYVPKETVANDLTEDLFTKNLAKVEFKSTDDLKKKVMDQSEVDNKAQLFLARSGSNTILYITDMKTGELIARAMLGERGSGSVGKKVDADDIQDLFKGLK